MDYVVASAWCHVRGLLFFLLSYDIMCQWFKNLRERLLKLPPGLRFHLAQYAVKYVIPKLHILRHLKSCQDFFSLLFTLGTAQANMEGIERIWSSSGPMGASTREMGPGLRQDTLDDFWHYWNWNKVVGMGKSKSAGSTSSAHHNCRAYSSQALPQGDKGAREAAGWADRVFAAPGGGGRGRLEEFC
jgi:hypothetical protein